MSFFFSDDAVCRLKVSTSFLFLMQAIPLGAQALRIAPWKVKLLIGCLEKPRTMESISTSNKAKVVSQHSAQATIILPTSPIPVRIVSGISARKRDAGIRMNL